jgi:hypothetical protein
MSDPLDDLFAPEERAEIEAWDADAYRISIEVPTSKITDEQLDDLFDRIASAAHDWEETLPTRDWDAAVYGHGPLHRKAP